jgi:leader peptidase (prepilin peptidase)/N-methyltransferase
VNLFFVAVFFLFGLLFGSFLNVCVYRMPRELSVVSPRSFCPECDTPIAAYDNIPVLSWIILRGKCRNCGAKISPRYAIVELLTGLFFVLSYLAASGFLPGLVETPAKCPDCDLMPLPIAGALKLCTLSFLLIGLIFTDAETKLLPDLLTKPGIGAGLLFSLFVPVEVCTPFALACVRGPAQLFLPSIENWRIASLVNSLAGALLGGGFILGIALLYEAVRGVEGMGRGDVKLMALIGAFLGVKQTLLVLLLGSLIGSCFGLLLILWVWRKRLARRRRTQPAESAGAASSRAWQSAKLIYRNFQIPFGVFLGAGALFAAFFGPALVRWYAGFF